MAIPVSSDNSNGANLNQVNNVIRQLENESQTKVFKGPNNVNALISGKLPNDLGYGLQLSDTDDVPRIIAYINSSDEPILKVSESGVDVTTASNDNLIFNSSQNVFKIALSGTITASPPASWTNGTVVRKTIPHGLSSTPAFMAFVDNPALGGSYITVGLSNLPSYIHYTASVGAVIASEAGVDSTNLYIDLINLTGLTAVGLDPYVWSYKYYILQETAT